MIDINNKTKTGVNTRQIKSIVEKFFKKYNIKSQISIALVGDRTIKRLNREQLGRDHITDVLAFSGEEDFFGEIIIGLAQVKRQAGLYGNSHEDELIFVLVHGLFHLMGYTDKTEKERSEMDSLTREFIAEISNL